MPSAELTWPPARLSLAAAVFSPSHAKGALSPRKKCRLLALLPALVPEQREILVSDSER